MIDPHFWTAVGGAATAAGLVVPFVHRFVYKPIRRGVDGLKTMHGRLEEIDKNLKPNQGKSLFDQVKKGTDRLGELEAQQRVNSETIKEIQEKTVDTNETLKRQVGRTDQVFDLMQQPLFEMDGEGQMTRVNAKFEQQIGVANADMLGGGWLSAIDMVEREPVLREIRFAASGRRAFRVIVTFEVGRRTIKTVMIGQPVVAGQLVLAFQGAVEVLSHQETPLHD